MRDKTPNRSNETCGEKSLSTAFINRLARLPGIKSIGKTIIDSVYAWNAHPAWSNALIHVIRGTTVVWLGKHRLEANPVATVLIPKGSMPRAEFDLPVRLEALLVFLYWQPNKSYFKTVPFQAVPGICTPKGIYREAQRGKPLT